MYAIFNYVMAAFFLGTAVMYFIKRDGLDDKMQYKYTRESIVIYSIVQGIIFLLATACDAISALIKLGVIKVGFDASTDSWNWTLFLMDGAWILVIILLIVASYFLTLKKLPETKKN